MKYKQILKNIKLFVYDFDGVMTNNKVYIDENGKEIVQVNRGDGLAISELNKMKFKQIIISTEKNKVVLKRALKLGIVALNGIENKEKELRKFCHTRKIKLSQVCYVGNDINDIDAINISGFSFCPKDSHIKVKKISNIVLKSKGGEGVIREVLEYF